MSAYRKGVLAVIAVGVLFFPVLPLIFALLGDRLSEAGVVIVILGWVAFASVAFWMQRCPVCRASVFLTKGGRMESARFWPRKTCSDCGKDLTAI